MTTTQPSVFEQATRVFQGWTDPETGLRVLRVHTGEGNKGRAEWSTIYHQFRPFLDGGRKLLLDLHPDGAHDLGSIVLDLTTGKTERPVPPGYRIREMVDGTRLAAVLDDFREAKRAMIWDLRAGREVAGINADGWTMSWMVMTGDGRRALVVRSKGKPWNEKVVTRHDLLTPGQAPRCVLEADGFFANHVMACPGDPELYAYDRWPSPMVKIDQAIHLHTLDGKRHETLKMATGTLKPGDTWGARDHYVWTPDGRRIVSYLCPHELAPLVKPGFNHFKWEWWLSATDVSTGEDFAARYPEGRFGGHMTVSPDSRQVICCGGPGFDKLFFVDIEKLRGGWNERVLCTYPKTTSEGTNSDPFPMPFPLPDQSGVVFNAGWPGPEHGVYLCEWPKD